MKCPNCGMELVPGGNFCGSCGSRVVQQPEQESEKHIFYLAISELHNFLQNHVKRHQWHTNTRVCQRLRCGIVKSAKL